MATYLGLAAAELRRAWRGLVAPGARARVYRPILRSLTVMCSGVALFYLARFVAFLAVGQDGRLFDVYLGTSVTTLVTTVMLATVSFSMTALSYADDTVELRTRATRDGLTGLLNREELLRQVEQRWGAHRRRASHGVVVMADLDDFKRVNDGHGHPIGDFALQTFAAACREALGPADLAGRVGGGRVRRLPRAGHPGGGTRPRGAGRCGAAGRGAARRRVDADRELRPGGGRAGRLPDRCHRACGPRPLRGEASRPRPRRRGRRGRPGPERLSPPPRRRPRGGR
jgi:hypothetical protein